MIIPNWNFTLMAPTVKDTHFHKYLCSVYMYISMPANWLTFLMISGDQWNTTIHYEISLSDIKAFIINIWILPIFTVHKSRRKYNTPRAPLNMTSPIKRDIESETGKFPVHYVCQHTLAIDVVLNINIQGRQRLTQPQVLGCVIQGNTATR